MYYLEGGRLLPYVWGTFVWSIQPPIQCIFFTKDSLADHTQIICCMPKLFNESHKHDLNINV